MKSRVKIDGKVMKELNSKIFRNSLIYTIVGAVMTIACAILMVCFGKVIKLNSWVLSFFAFLLGIGLVGLWSYFRIYKASIKDNKVNEIEFFEDYFESQILKNEEPFMKHKVEYKDIYKIKETEDYIFIYLAANNAFVVDKKVFSHEELTEVKLLIYKHNPKKVK